MAGKLRWGLWLGLGLALGAMLIMSGCKSTPVTYVKQLVGLEKSGDDDEDQVPPEAQQETVMVDGKPYVRSRNPYYITYPQQPEYIYVEKGKEYVGVQQGLINSLAKAIGREKQKAAGKTIPPDKLQEMVRAEVDRILREQGLGGFVSRSRGEATPFTGRAVAVIPDLDTPRTLDGLNRTLAVALGEALARQKDVRVSTQEQIKEALGKAGIVGKLTLRKNIQTLGDYLGVQGLVLTGILPPDKGAGGFMALEVYDTFLGTKSQAVVEPAPSEGLKPEVLTRFANQSALRVTGELLNMDWFGRVEFVKEGKVYLSLGQNVGLKVGGRLKVVEPGKEVVNPQTHASLGFTADVPQGELKVTELLGNTGAVAQVVSGGPFKANDKVKAK